MLFIDSWGFKAFQTLIPMDKSALSNTIRLPISDDAVVQMHINIIKDILRSLSNLTKSPGSRWPLCWLGVVEGVEWTLVSSPSDRQLYPRRHRLCLDRDPKQPFPRLTLFCTLGKRMKWSIQSRIHSGIGSFPTMVLDLSRISSRQGSNMHDFIARV